MPGLICLCFLIGKILWVARGPLLLGNQALMYFRTVLIQRKGLVLSDRETFQGKFPVGLKVTPFAISKDLVWVIRRPISLEII